jgi:Domain of unknown function (DUF4397)
MTHHALARRITRLLAACALVVGWLAVAAPAALASPAVPAVQATGFLRLAHLSPNAPSVDVYLYSVGNPNAMVVVHHVSYGTVSTYQSVPSGSYTVAMRAAGQPSTSPPVLSTTVQIQSGRAYTVAGMGPAAGLRLQVLDDTLTTPPGQSLVRVIQASLKEHKVTVTAGGRTLTSNLVFGSVTSYVPVPAGTWNVTATGGSMNASKSVTLAANSTHTIVVLDDPGRLGIDPLTDAAGSNLMPAGAPGTGLGGMAARPGSSPLPWVAAIALGALVAAGGTLGLRRRGHPRAAGGSHAR